MFQNENQFPKRQRISESMPNRRTNNRTEPCLRFQRGICFYGDRCCFVHSHGDFRRLDKRQELIPLGDPPRVKCFDENQNPRCSDNSKICWRFMSGESCPFGDKCHFSHIKTERTTDVISVVDVAGSGEMQQQKQLPWKTRLCNRWMSTGSCPYGFRCCFAHGESELRSSDARAYGKNVPCKSVEEKIDGKGWEFKWKNVEKIGRVYADWIN